MSILRAIGDVHGCITERFRYNDLPSYVELCKELGPNDYSIQVGDMGFVYDDITKNVDANHHKFFYGNHDNADTYYDCPNALGDYGKVDLGPFSFFFVRGAFSLDKKYRIRNEEITKVKSWWKEEELTYRQGLECLDLYERTKPAVVFSHDCPTDISFLIGNPDIVMAFGYPRSMVTATQELLQQMADVHQPKLHIFGHYHRDWEVKYKGTHYICIDERRYIDFDKDWNIVGKSGTERKSSGL